MTESILDSDPRAATYSYGDLLTRPGNQAGTSWSLLDPDDRLGTLALQTGPRRLRALAVPREGRSFGLDTPLTLFSPSLSTNRGELVHTVQSSSTFIVDDKLDNFYPQAASQIDGLMHVEHPTRGFYGGRTRAEVEADPGLLGIDVWARHGILGRGILVDIARHSERIGRTIDYRDNDTFDVDVIEEAAADQGVVFEVGDVLLLRTGWMAFYCGLDARERAEMPRPLRAPGLAPTRETVAWLWDRHFSMVAADNPALEAFPSPTPEPDAEVDESVPPEHRGLIHATLIPLLGLAIGELWDLEALSEHALASGRHECLVASTPLAVPGGIGSTGNAMAVV